MSNLIDPGSDRIFYELNDLKDDRELLTAVKTCIEFQKAAGAHMLDTFFKPNPSALDEVSEETLVRIMQTGSQGSDMRVDRSLSNCIVFNSRNMEGSVQDEALTQLRNGINRMVRDRFKRFLDPSYQFVIQDSGHFWYPPGGFLSWHTNVRTPGWRLYINYCEEKGKSFFRYRDPDTGKIVTSWDDTWNFRLFRIDPKRLFWHSVYSETNRFSLGYRILASERLSFPKRIARKLQAILS